MDITYRFIRDQWTDLHVILEQMYLIDERKIVIFWPICAVTSPYFSHHIQRTDTRYDFPLLSAPLLASLTVLGQRYSGLSR